MKILLNWTYDSDIVECPSKIAENLLSYQLKFDEWVNNENNDYWTDGVFGFDSDTFVNWLNLYVLDQNEENAVIIKRGITPNEEQKKLPHINF